MTEALPGDRSATALSDAPAARGRARPSVCFVGYYNLPVLAPEFGHLGVGGEEVQHTLLATAFARRGFDVSMVVHDLGQAEGKVWSGVRTHKAFAPRAGVPVLRFVHPRWTGLWHALKRADAQVYYVSTAGVHVGQVALFARLYGRRAIFRVAHDANCSPRSLMIKYARDRWMYEWGLHKVDAILAQTEHQQRLLRANYRVDSIVARMPVASATSALPFTAREVAVLWVNNFRAFKRPERYVDMATSLPALEMHMIGGAVEGHHELHAALLPRIAATRNLRYHGAVPYHAVNDYYARARVFVNTSDTEGFPNSFLQSWARGTPVVSYFDPDGLIAREGLGVHARSPAEMCDAVRLLCHDEARWAETSARCSAYMRREYNEDDVLEPYRTTIERLAALVER